MPEWSNPASLSRDAQARRPRILVVDDQPLVIRLLNETFSADHEVFMATSGQQALDFCGATPPDLILLDVEMPVMDGTEVLRQLKATPDLCDIPVIFVTSNAGPEAESRCWDAGAVDFITKPINQQTVRARVRVHLALKYQSDLLRQMAYIDGLTGVANRRYFDTRLEMEMRRCQRRGQHLSLLMIDVDYFKRYNDNYGHLKGDVCLHQIAQCMQKLLSRPYDLVARYGGEEFACLLPETDEATALRIATGIEVAVRLLQLPHVGSEVASTVTVSIGVASLQVQQLSKATSLLQLADQRLYQAKQAGRARVFPQP